MRKTARNVRRPKGVAQDAREKDRLRAKIIGRGLRKDRRLPLRALREAEQETQVDVARLADMSQGDVSRLEQQDDIKLSTLRRYVRALGAELECTAVFPTGRRVGLDV